MPLLTELSNWRVKMTQIERELAKESEEYDLTFVADFNGLKLENFISSSLNASIEVLQGAINVEFEEVAQPPTWNVKPVTNARSSTNHDRRLNRTLVAGQKIKVPSGEYHNVYTISVEPSCYFYVYVNQSAISTSRLFEKFIDNAMSQFDENYLKLSSGKRFNESYDEAVTWKAYNKTKVYIAENFLDMISFNDSKKLEGPVEEREKLFIKELDEKNLLTQMYELFNEKFHSQVKNKLEREGHNLLTKLYRKMSNNMQRFKIG
jgi:hypothetical protein